MDKNEFDFILQEGEGYKIEFKESLSGLDRELCAFANASGGFIYPGVRDDGTVTGIHINNKLKSQVTDIAANCDPPVKIVLKEHENVLIIDVREGTDKPYRCAGGFYNRIGPNAQKLKRDEIIEFVQSEGKIRFDELVFKDFNDGDFDSLKLAQFLKLANISPLLDAPNILRNLHVAEIQHGETIYYNSAVLFFAKNLDHHYFHTTVTCALYKGNEKVDILDRKDFNQDLKFNVDETMLFLQRHLSVRYEFDGSPRRKEIPAIPTEALREAVLNAVIHRDYFDKSGNVMVEVFPNRVEITSPGGLPKGLKPEEFGTRSVLRNPNLANLFQRLDYIEKMGTGIRRIQQMVADAGLPEVTYRWGSFVTVVFPFEGKEALGATSPETTETSPETRPETAETSPETTQEIIVNLIKQRPAITRQEIAETIGLSLAGVKYQLAALRRAERIRHIGSTKKGYWEIIEQEK